MSLVVPFDVPLMTTFAPGRDSYVSASLILPDMLPDCAYITPDMKSIQVISKIFFMLTDLKLEIKFVANIAIELQN
jgi:hypothetical protein